MTKFDSGDLYALRPIGIVRSPLKRREDCPHQGYDGAPEAWVELNPMFADGLDRVTPGGELILLTWLHEGRRDVLMVHPRGKTAEPLQGVFLTRSPDRPNPIGLHRVRVVAVKAPTRILVRPLEALDGTPVIDIKAVLAKSEDG